MRPIIPKVSLRWPALELACVLALLACGSTGPSGDLLLEGTITNAVNGGAISGATVGVGDGSGFVIKIVQSTTTDSQGRYTLSHHGCIKSPYIQAAATGYNANDKSVPCRAETQTVNISLTPAP
jgi:hypothetical protein